MICGIVFIVNAFFLSIVPMIISVLMLLIIPMIYSYIIYQKVRVKNNFYPCIKKSYLLFHIKMLYLFTVKNQEKYGIL